MNEIEQEYDSLDELKKAVEERTFRENVAVALENMELNWHRHGDEALEETELILEHLLSSLEAIPEAKIREAKKLQERKHSAAKHEEMRLRELSLQEVLDLDKFAEAYLAITAEYFSEAEGEVDLRVFREALLELPNAAIRGGRLSGVTREQVREVFKPLFGPEANSEELALSLRKYLEISFIRG